MKKYIMLCMLILLTGCATKNIYQIDGMPVPDKVVKAKVFALNMTVKYKLVKSFQVKEDDEAYRSYEYLSMFIDDYHMIKRDDVLNIHLNIFNPVKGKYKVVQTIIYEGGEAESYDVYKGDLSRNVIEFRLPKKENGKVVSYFDIYDDKSNLIYQSFKAKYKLKG